MSQQLMLNFLLFFTLIK